jgi:hypothetical protein
MQIKKSILFKDELHYKIFNLINANISTWNLSENEIKVLSSFYNKDFELLTKIKDYDLRMKILFDKKNKDEISNQYNLSYNTFNNVLTSLRKKNFIKDNTIDEKYLQDLNKKEIVFSILFLDENREIIK